ncbi:amino acid adenylation domain-containing protein [Belliella sp. DSM 107340]|uniref:Amino acid adenylation domain-containing protein n=1 Tax=Belliella calami TaxID=2923436 RepID=A0ABS9UU38_9BACT|nr:polyketide synthase [Belliella calami]MCH7400136.1 amino acid adenylation domain-containing protein [Belliella calami]
MATLSPESIAVVYNGEKITYSKLNEESDLLRNYILSNHANEKIIGISTSKNIHTITGMLAILKAGKAYLPLDLDSPLERTSSMIAIADVKSCISPQSEFDGMARFGLSNISLTERGKTQIAISNLDTDLAVILFTSGSTGEPKGVEISHQGISELISYQLEKIGDLSDEHILQFGYLGFDASILEIFVALSSGRTIHLIDEINRLDPRFLLDYICKYSISRIFLPYVSLQYFANEVVKSGLYPASLKEIATGGELLKITPNIKKCFQKLPNARLKNMYGPTEASVLVTEHVLDKDPEKWEEIPNIGSAIADCRLYVLDENYNKCKEGEFGELYIMGNCLAKGYINREALTAERFINLSTIDPDFDIAYKTGDVVSFDSKGSFHFKGRVDDQVKIRGNRVELGEVELNINMNHLVDQAVVKLDFDASGQKMIVGYVQFHQKNPDNIGSLKAFLKNSLPDYMIPDFIVEMDVFNKTASGKIDKKSLPKPQQIRMEVPLEFVNPNNDFERDVCRIFATVLQYDIIGMTDNFFEFGGNSLKAQKLITLLGEKIQVHVPIIKLYQHPTVQDFVVNVCFDGSEQPLKQTDKSPKNNNAPTKDVAVIGVVGRFPGANDTKELWDILKSNKETIRVFDEADMDNSIDRSLLNNPFYVRARGVVEGLDMFDASFFGLNKNLAEMMDPQQRVFLEVAYELLESSGYRIDSKALHIGVFAGISSNTYFTNNLLTHPEKIKDLGDFQVSALNEKDFIASRTSYHLNLTGPAVSVYSACSTSLLAIVQAVESIRLGNCEMAIAGGASVKSPMISGHLYEEGAAYSKDGHCKSFDADAKGTVFSDGAGVVLLKEIDAAKRDGDNILAIIKGVGVNNDGGNKGSFSAPSVEGQAIAIRTAIQDAGISADQISFIEAHGTGTPLGDPIEIEGLKLAFGNVEQKGYCAIGSIKSNMGHLNAASGVSGFIKAVLSIQNKQMAPVHGFQRLNPNIDIAESPFFINEQLRSFPEDKKLFGGVSSFGVGGTNVHVILGEPDSVMLLAKSEKDYDHYLINWSAKSERSLKLFAGKILAFLSDNPDVLLKDIAATLQLSRHSYSKKAFLIVKDKIDLKEKLQKIVTFGLESQNTTSVKDFAFIFTGQGAQYLNMGRSLYDSFETYKNAIDDCIKIINPIMGMDFGKVIFPDNNSPEANSLLRNTKFTQPAIFITEYALGKLWIELGVAPLVLCGHSIGEFNAAVFADVMTLEDAIGLVCRRGQLMSELPVGAMLAVRAKPDTLIGSLPIGVSLAAINTPGACVVAGEPERIKEFALKLQLEGVQSRMLQTSHAFHSHMMAPAVDLFEKEFEKITLNRPRLPIVSTATGALLKDEEAVNPKYWANQILSPVLFSDAILSIEETGAFNFLEVGPGNVLSSLVRQHNLNSKPLIVSSVSQTDEVQTEFETFLLAVAKIWSAGAKVDFSKFYNNPQPLYDFPTYAFDKQRFWLEPNQKNHERNPTHGQTSLQNINIEKINTNTAMESKDTFSQKIQEIILNATGVQMPDENTTFSEMGLDSLILTQLGAKFRNEFGIQLTFRQLNEDLQNVGKIVAYVKENISENDRARYIIPASQNESSQPSYFQAALPSVQSQVTNSHLPAAAVDHSGQNMMINLIAQQMELLSRQLSQIQQQSTPIATTIPPVAGITQATQEVAPPVALSNNPKIQLTEAEQTELKKPFGAIARIQKKDVELNDIQKKFIEDHSKRYMNATKSSKAYTQEHRSYMADPRVVSGFKPSLKEMIYSPVVNKSLGSKLWDIDGNEYLDVLNGFGSIIFGHRPDFINERLKEQLENGYEIGPQHPLSGKICKLICEMTDHDRAALCNTGSEAVMGAMRIARTVTDKRLIVSFNGSYHGIFDEAIVRGVQNKSVFPAASGIMEESVQNMLVLDYGTDESLRIIQERIGEIAAVLVEPVQSRRPEFRPVEFLKKVREITSKSGSALIFDEVITGFRMHPKGAQGIFKIKADICTYGKVIGGGLPIGAIGGTRRFMDALDGGHWEYGDASLPEIGVTYFAGTFVRHPLALVSSLAALEFMKNDAGKMQYELTMKTDQLAEELNAFFVQQKLPFEIVHFGSLWKFKPKYEINHTELIFSLMRERGIHIYDGFPCFMTTAHTALDLEKISQTFKNSVLDLMDAGFFMEHRILENV